MGRKDLYHALFVGLHLLTNRCSILTCPYFCYEGCFMKRNIKTMANAFLVILAVFTMLSVTAMVSAQKDAEEATEAAKSSGVEYYLPYPGILPGHPLYPIKMLRDRILSFFITDPVKKAEFYLLMADKRLNAGQFLVRYGKQQLGEQTMSKGEKYFIQAVDMTKTAGEKGKDIKPLVERMEKAALKHEEILTEIIEKGPSDIKSEVEVTLKMVKDLQPRITELKQAR